MPIFFVRMVPNLELEIGVRQNFYARFSHIHTLLCSLTRVRGRPILSIIRAYINAQSRARVALSARYSLFHDRERSRECDTVHRHSPLTSAFALWPSTPSMSRVISTWECCSLICSISVDTDVGVEKKSAGWMSDCCSCSRVFSPWIAPPPRIPIWARSFLRML